MERRFNIVDHIIHSAHTAGKYSVQVHDYVQKIAVIGECMIELSQKGADVSRGFGGDTLNTAVYIARQAAADALSVNYVTATGTDSFSQQMLDAAE